MSTKPPTKSRADATELAIATAVAGDMARRAKQAKATSAQHGSSVPTAIIVVLVTVGMLAVMLAFGR